VEFKSEWILRKEAWCCGQSQRQGKGGQRGEGVKSQVVVLGVGKKGKGSGCVVLLLSGGVWVLCE
jgi:hypothetical protein